MGFRCAGHGPGWLRSRAATDNVDRILELGLAQSGNRQYREAIQTFTRGIEIEPDNPVLYRCRGHRHLPVREFDLARTDLERALALASTLHRAW